jgi:hypothetical protein
MLCFLVDTLVGEFLSNSDNRQLSKKHNTYQLFYVYIQCTSWWWATNMPKHVEVDWRNKPRISSASSWFSLHRNSCMLFLLHGTSCMLFSLHGGSCMLFPLHGFLYAVFITRRLLYAVSITRVPVCCSHYTERPLCYFHYTEAPVCCFHFSRLIWSLPSESLSNSFPI